ncbi:hypothetical protein APA_2615 [Pseudanabaena sp. lw0831]|nr:hypothetical protein APA_2615 [Pseudanabaena sp. lw0831]
MHHISSLGFRFILIQLQNLIAKVSTRSHFLTSTSTPIFSLKRWLCYLFNENIASLFVTKP